MAYTPFQLIQNIYDVVNLKKIYNIFPTSLRVTQLTSNQLLDFLQGRVDEQNEEIQRLLALLRESTNQQLDLSALQNLLDGLDSTIGGEIADLLSGAGATAEDSALQAQITAKISQGYKRFGDSLVFIKTNTIPVPPNRSEFSGYEFGGNQFDVNGDSIRGDHVNPTTISLSNLSDTDVEIRKIEQYEGAYRRGQFLYPPAFVTVLTINQLEQ
jgi:hypothetical protein